MRPQKIKKYSQYQCQYRFYLSSCINLHKTHQRSCSSDRSGKKLFTINLMHLEGKEFN